MANWGVEGLSPDLAGRSLPPTCPSLLHPSALCPEPPVPSCIDGLRTPRKPPLSSRPRPAPQAGGAFGGSAGASSRPRDHRGKPPCPAARRRGLSDHLPMLWPTGHLGSHWPVRESGVPLRLQREPAALAGASRGLSGGSDHHQQAEEECVSGHFWREWEHAVFRLLSLPPSGPSHGTVVLPASTACSGRWSACRSIFCLVARP